MKRKFFQKKQLVLIAMTVVIMMCVWFVKSPLFSKKDQTPVIETTTTTSIFEDLRNAVLDQRATEVATWDAILSDSNATVASKQTALVQKNALSDITEKEVILEIEVINMGFEDAFVHSTSSGVEVYVKVEEDSATSAIEIINLVYSHFDNAENVIVNFKTE